MVDLLVLGDDGDVRNRVDLVVGEVHVEERGQHLLRHVLLRDLAVAAFALEVLPVDRATCGGEMTLTVRGATCGAVMVGLQANQSPKWLA
jgi:hypothetical protein